MIDRTGQLWDYRPGENFEWKRILVLRSDWGPHVADYVGAKIFHVCMFVATGKRTDLIENLEIGDKNAKKWDNFPESFKRIA